MNSRVLLLCASATIIIVWQLPHGRQILYPLSLLATYAHEMGHGLTALVFGAQFQQLILHADGSGMAVWQGKPGRVAMALIAAGGLLGPTLAGISLLLLSRSWRAARFLLAVLAVLLTTSVVLWSGNTFGTVFLLASAATLALGARVLPDGAAAFLLHLIAVTLCLSWFTDLDYMFSAQAVVNGATTLSDSAVMAQALWLPYWFWGGLIALISLTVALLGIRLAGRSSG